MEIDVIVPSNNEEEINDFLKSFYEFLPNFKNHCNVYIVGNGDLKNKPKCQYPFSFIRVNEDYKGKIVPFIKLRSIAMKNSDCDYFLFFDGDHRFNEKSEPFLNKCVYEMQRKKTEGKVISVLCTDKVRDGSKGLEYKLDAFIWTNLGLFIKNIGIDFEKYNSIIGCGEDLLFSYLTIDKIGIPYTLHGSPIERTNKRLFAKGEKEVNDISYCKQTIDNNVYKLIREKYDEKGWCNEAIYYNTKLPIKLKRKIDERISNSSK